MPAPPQCVRCRNAGSVAARRFRLAGGVVAKLPHRRNDERGVFLVVRFWQIAQGQAFDARRFDGQPCGLVEDHLVVGRIPAQQLVDQRLQAFALGVQAAALQVA